MSKMTAGTRHISVTLDFLRTLPGLDVRDEIQLRKALHHVGFQMLDEEGKPSKIEMLTNVNVRCKDKPFMYRKTNVFVGRMRPKYMFERMYENVEILDVGVYDGDFAEFVNELPDYVPAIDKPNTRKYTKRADRNELLEPATAEEIEMLTGGME